MNKYFKALIALPFLALVIIHAGADTDKSISNLELNIRILQEQFDNTVVEMREAGKNLVSNLGAYEGMLVGRYQLETQIRKQQKKLAKLKGDSEYESKIDPEINIYNNSILKLLITVHSENPEYDGLQYFAFQAMDIHFPIDQVKYLQISDYKEDNIYPIYKVKEIDLNKKLVLNLAGHSYQ